MLNIKRMGSQSFDEVVNIKRLEDSDFFEVLSLNLDLAKELYWRKIDLINLAIAESMTEENILKEMNVVARFCINEIAYQFATKKPVDDTYSRYS